MQEPARNNKILLLSTAYFPPIDYMALISKYQSITIEINETYYKQTWRNRCSIMTANGIQNLTIPVIKPNGNKTKTGDIKIFNDEKWYLNHNRAIQSAYSNSPFYLYYIDYFIDLFSDNHPDLISFNTLILKRISKIFDFDINIVFTENYINENGPYLDFRFRLSPKKDGLILNYPEYMQVFSDRYNFIPNLSILDLIFNLGPESKNYLQECATLIP